MLALRIFLTLLLVGTIALEDALAESPPDSSSSTVIGANSMLADGTAAMLNGDWERGIQLTQMGIDGVVAAEDRAAAYANLCAGYIALKKYERAVENCDQSLALTPSNWRAWQNRAAANLHMGKLEECFRDLARGLQINPDSDALQKTLSIARDQEKLRQERLDNLVES